jgi:Cu/Ag efflux pump CusA
VGGSLREHKNEFQRVVKLCEVTLDVKISTRANLEELAHIAKRFDVEKIKRFEFEYIITKKEDIWDAYSMFGRIVATVVNFSVAGKDESIDIDEKFDVTLLSEDAARNNYEQLQDLDIEVFDKNKEIDVGEIAAQYLSLCIFM